MDLYSLLIGSHIWFAREGDAFLAGTDQNGAVLGAGVVGKNAKPNAVDGAGVMLAPYLDIGTIEEVTPTVAQQEYKLWKPAPGRKVLKDLLESQQELSFKVTTNEVSSLTFEAFFRSSVKLDAGQKQFNPLSAVSRKGFIHMECYDDQDELVMTMEAYARVRTSMKFAGEPVKPEWEIYCLHSGCNVGLLGA